MSWAARKRLLILAIIAVVALIALVLLYYATLYHAPSCTDRIQNEGEAGIDCGGPCPYLCLSQAQAPVVRFTQSLAGAPGRTDVIAYIDNPNQNAYARGVSYEVEVFGPDHTLAGPTIAGTTDLPSGATVPIFIPNIDSSRSPISTAFLMVDSTDIKWQAGRDVRVVPSIVNQILSGTKSNPHITAVLSNPSAYPMQNVKVIVAVFNSAGNVIAASSTVLPSISGQGSAQAIFTWNSAFSSTPARIDVLPVIGLP